MIDGLPAASKIEAEKLTGIWRFLLCVLPVLAKLLAAVLLQCGFGCVFWTISCKMESLLQKCGSLTVTVQEHVIGHKALASYSPCCHVWQSQKSLQGLIAPSGSLTWVCIAQTSAWCINLVGSENHCHAFSRTKGNYHASLLLFPDIYKQMHLLIWHQCVGSSDIGSSHAMYNL